MKKWIALMVLTLALFGAVLYEVSKIPEGTPGLLAEKEAEDITVNLTRTPMISQVPGWLFDDPEPTKEVTIATPSQAIEEPLKVVKKPKETYVGTYTLTAYIATGNRCADGQYPQVGYTVACNDRRLWKKRIRIEGYGEYYVHDTGGMPSSSIIDVFVGSYDEAIQFGRRSGEVYIIGE